MVQIINDPNRTSSAQWANSLSQSINRLAEQKVQQIGQQRLYDSLVAGGVDPTHARVLTRLTPQERMSYFQNLGGFGGEGMGSQQNPEAQDIQTTLQSLSPVEPQQMQQMQQPQLPALSGEEALMRAVRDYQQRQQPQAAQQFIQQQGEKGSQQAQSRPTALTSRAGVPQRGVSRTGAKPSVAQILGGPTPEQRLKLKIHHENLSDKQQARVDSNTKESYDKIHKEARAAKDNLKRLDQMERLIVRGGLNSPGFSSFVDAFKSIFKVDLSGLETADSQEFRKLSNDFVKNAKDYFGSRLTDADLKVFMATIPTLTQSGEAKQRVLENLRLFADIALAREKVSDDVIEANGGHRPSNYDSLVEKELKPLEDQLVKRFYDNKRALEDLTRKLEEDRSKKEASRPRIARYFNLEG